MSNAQIGYGGFWGLGGSTADINKTFSIPATAKSVCPIDIEMNRTTGSGFADISNSEWDSYKLTEVSDKGNIGNATLNRSEHFLGLDKYQLDGSDGFGGKNDYQHDNFHFTLDTSSTAWKNLAIGKSLTVTYRVDATEYLPCYTEKDSLTISFTFTKTCFAADSLIRMADGTEKRADAIMVGDLVATADHGAQPVRWVGRNTVLAAEMTHFAQWRPIRIAAGALGNGLPEADLLVSQLHRILVTGSVAQDHFGAAEVLVPARFLTDLEGVDVVEMTGDLTYVHFMFDAHEVVWANGARSESFYVSPMSRSQIGEAQLVELESLFPELGQMARNGQPAPARPFVRGDDAISLASMHRANGVPLQ